MKFYRRKSLGRTYYYFAGLNAFHGTKKETIYIEAM